MCARPPLPCCSCCGCGVVAVFFFYWIVSLSSKRLSSVPAIYLLWSISGSRMGHSSTVIYPVPCFPYSLCALNDNFKWNRIKIYIVFSLMAIGHGWQWKRNFFNSQPQLWEGGCFNQAICVPVGETYSNHYYFSRIDYRPHVSLHETLNYHIERSFDGQR